MDEALRNKLGFWFFFVFVIFIAVGGYFFTQYVINMDTNEYKNNSGKISDIKIDKNKDYIFYENEKLISEHKEIIYKDVVINLKNHEILNETLKKENQIYKNSIQYISKQKEDISDIIVYNNDDLYALNFREYKTYQFDKYLSLVINDYNYTCFDDTTFKKTKSYVFDIQNGSMLEEKDILKKYNLNMDSIKDKIRNHLKESQVIVDEEELIKIDETLKSLDNYSLYINEYGRLYISYLVKTTEVDYNEVMEVK